MIIRNNAKLYIIVVFQPQSSPRARAGIYDHSSAALVGSACALRIPEKECVCVFDRDRVSYLGY